MRKLVSKLAADQSGVTALEYGLLAALIAGVIIIPVTNLGKALENLFTSIAGDIQNAA